MKRISSEKTFVYRYIVPYVFILCMLGFIGLSIYSEIYMFIIFPVMLLICYLILRLPAFLNLSEISICEEREIFEIKRSRSTILLPYKHLQSIKVSGYKTLIQLKFREGKFFLIPKNTSHFFPNCDPLISYLQDIVKKNNDYVKTV